MESQAVFDSLSDATRRRILALLIAQGELCVCELVYALNQIQPNVSRHLSVMKDAGLVVPRRVGTWMHYRIAPMPSWAENLLHTLADGAVPELKADLKRLKAMASRPDRYAA